MRGPAMDNRLEAIAGNPWADGGSPDPSMRVDGLPPAPRDAVFVGLYVADPARDYQSTIVVVGRYARVVGETTPEWGASSGASTWSYIDGQIVVSRLNLTGAEQFIAFSGWVGPWRGLIYPRPLTRREFDLIATHLKRQLTR